MWSPARIKTAPGLPHLLTGYEGRTSTTKEILPFPELMRRCLMDGRLWSVETGALIHH